MRLWIAAFAVLMLFAGAPASQAAPGCQNRGGQWVRCDAKDAMPVGWTVPEGERVVYAPGAPADTKLAVETVLIIVLLLILVGFLPDFDGRSDADWVEKKPTKKRM